MFLVIAAMKIFSAITNSFKTHQKVQETRTTHFKDRPIKPVTNFVLNTPAKLSEPSKFVFVHVSVMTSPTTSCSYS